MENNQLIESRINVYSFFDKLNEEYHEMTNFDVAIKDIVKQLQYSNYDNFYTGWNWFINEKKCLKVNTEYNNGYDIKYNENKGCPIYIHFFIDDNTDTILYVGLREKSYNIIIYFNLYFKQQFYDIKNCILLLKHEFTHVRTMYSNINYNPLNSLKNKASCINIQKLKSIISYNILPYIQDLCYILSPTEQQSYLNEYIEFIKQYIKDNELEKYNNYDIISELITNGDEYSKLTIFYNLINKFNTRLTPIYIQIGYVLNNYNLLKINISQEDVVSSKKNMFNNTYQIKAEKIFNYLQNNFQEYYKKIKNVTYKVLKENNII